MKRHLQNNQGGASLFLGLFGVIFALALISALFQNYSAIMSVKTVHAAMEKAALTADTRQTEQTYQSKRESYHGAYSNSDGAGWHALMADSDVVAQLKEMLSVHYQSGQLIKYDKKGDLIYLLENISLVMQNPDFQSQDAPLQAVLSLDFNMPLKLGSIEHPIQVHLKVTAENKTKY